MLARPTGPLLVASAMGQEWTPPERTLVSTSAGGEVWSSTWFLEMEGGLRCEVGTELGWLCQGRVCTHVEIPEKL